MTRTTDTTLTNIFSPSIRAWRERYAAERAAAPGPSGPVPVRARGSSRKRGANASLAPGDPAATR